MPRCTNTRKKFSIITEFPALPAGIYHTGLCNHMAKEGTPLGEIVNNGRFVPIIGAEHFNGTDITFPVRASNDRKEHENDYLTLFGWNCASTAVIWADTDINMSLACRRHFAKVMPDYEHEDPDDFDRNLRANQRVFFATKGEVIRKIYQQYAKFKDDMSFVDMAIEMSEEPNPKKEIRRSEIKQLLESNAIAKSVWLKSVWWKPKRLERAKKSTAAKPKYIRMIVDCGVGASLQTVPFAARVKKMTDGVRVDYKGCTCIFYASPKPETIANEIQRLWSSTHDVMLLYYSDDAVIAIKILGELRIFNADLSSNDSCKTEALIENLLSCAGASDEVTTAVRLQIKATIRIISKDRKSVILFKPLETYLQSGIGITTTVNCHTWLCEFVNIVDNINVIHSPLDLIKVCELVGHKVTLEECHVIEDVQFLKMSVVKTTDSTYQAILNLGVILRASGSCKMDLPGRGDMATRARDFQAGLMNGLLTGIGYQPLNKLRGTGKAIKVDWRSASGSLYARDLEQAEKNYHSHDFYRRYRLSQCEIDELESLIAQSGVGTTIYCCALDKIFKKDYGLGCPVTLV